jgi:flagellin-like protein
MDFKTILVIPTVLIYQTRPESSTMKIRNGKNAQRKAISPIIATVLIIAVTLIAAVAIGGFVFGIFGTSSQSAQIQVTTAALAHADFTTGGAGTAVTACGNAVPATSYMTLTNSGTAGATVTGVSLTWAGATNPYTLPAGCTVGAAGSTGSTGATVYLTFASEKIATLVVAGQTYSGTITLSNGAQLLFTGTWQ